MIFTQSEGLPTEPLRPNAKVFYYAREVVKSKSQRELKDHDFMKEFYELHFDVDHLLPLWNRTVEDEEAISNSHQCSQLYLILKNSHFLEENYVRV